MADNCGCHAAKTETRDQRRVLVIALALNATMFVVGLIAGLIAQSSGLLADALDMLADAEEQTHYLRVYMTHLRQ